MLKDECDARYTTDDATAKAARQRCDHSEPESGACQWTEDSIHIHPARLLELITPATRTRKHEPYAVVKLESQEWWTEFRTTLFLPPWERDWDYEADPSAQPQPPSGYKQRRPGTVPPRTAPPVYPDRQPLEHFLIDPEPLADPFWNLVAQELRREELPAARPREWRRPMPAQREDDAPQAAALRELAEAIPTDGSDFFVAPCPGTVNNNKGELLAVLTAFLKSPEGCTVKTDSSTAMSLIRRSVLHRADSTVRSGLRTNFSHHLRAAAEVHQHRRALAAAAGRPPAESPRRTAMRTTPDRVYAGRPNPLSGAYNYLSEHIHRTSDPQGAPGGTPAPSRRARGSRAHVPALAGLPIAQRMERVLNDAYDRDNHRADRLAAAALALHPCAPFSKACSDGHGLNAWADVESATWQADPAVASDPAVSAAAKRAWLARRAWRAPFNARLAQLTKFSMELAPLLPVRARDAPHLYGNINPQGLCVRPGPRPPPALHSASQPETHDHAFGLCSASQAARLAMQSKIYNLLHTTITTQRLKSAATRYELPDGLKSDGLFLRDLFPAFALADERRWRQTALFTDLSHDSPRLSVRLLLPAVCNRPRGPPKKPPRPGDTPSAGPEPAARTRSADSPHSPPTNLKATSRSDAPPEPRHSPLPAAPTRPQPSRGPPAAVRRGSTPTDLLAAARYLGQHQRHKEISQSAQWPRPQRLHNKLVARGVSPFDFDVLLFPIHSPGHWTFAAIHSRLERSWPRFSAGSSSSAGNATSPQTTHRLAACIGHQTPCSRCCAHWRSLILTRILATSQRPQHPDPAPEVRPSPSGSGSTPPPRAPDPRPPRPAPPPPRLAHLRQADRRRQALPPD
eukprot:tig00000411_g546.t3